jgi:UPF0716 protein FxsA
VFARLLLLFTVVPLLELYLLIQIGGIIGTVPTVALVFVTGLVGAYLAKREGLKVFRAWQRAIENYALPKEGIVSGLLVLVGGILLVTPGVVTDFCGLLLLVPPVRRRFATWLQSYARDRFVMHVELGAPASRGGPPDVVDIDPAEVRQRAQPPVAVVDGTADRSIRDRAGPF